MIVLWQEVAKMDDIWLKIKELAAAGNGIVSTKQVEHMGISRIALKKYVEEMP